MNTSTQAMTQNITLWQNSDLICCRRATEAFIVLQLCDCGHLSTNNTTCLLGSQLYAAKSAILSIKHQQLLPKWSCIAQSKTGVIKYCVPQAKKKNLWLSMWFQWRIHFWPEAIFSTSKAWRQPMTRTTAMKMEIYFYTAHDWLEIPEHL